MIPLKLIGRSLLVCAVLLHYVPLKVFADCECGYGLGVASAGDSNVFTDVLESDFTSLTNITRDTDWVVQEWKIDKVASKGPFGRHPQVKNAVSNPSKSPNSAAGINGKLAGLELWARSVKENDEYVSVAEVDSRRTDMKYGTFRAGIETTRINGTCSAFFWYLNDTQEIDMEFLSSQRGDRYGKVNLVLHTPMSLDRGGDASRTPTFKVVPLDFDPAGGIHEYRFDWNPASVCFYADGKLLIEMNQKEYIPQIPGKIIMSHWSNGQPLWSGGPPEEDAKMVVSYVKAYFNSSDPGRIRDHTLRCPNPRVDKGICQIPDQIGVPRSISDIHFFHKDPNGNMTNNQSIYAISKRSAAYSALCPSLTTILLAAFFGFGLTWAV